MYVIHIEGNIYIIILNLCRSKYLIWAVGMQVDQQSMKMGDMTWFTKQDSSGDVEIDKRQWYSGCARIHMYTLIP